MRCDVWIVFKFVSGVDCNVGLVQIEQKKILCCMSLGQVLVVEFPLIFGKVWESAGKHKVHKAHCIEYRHGDNSYRT